MSNLLLNLPINSLSFGNCSINILNEFFKRGEKLNIIPLQNQLDVSAFKINDEFAAWLQTGISNAPAKHNRSVPSLKLWHIQGAMESMSEKQYLLTFYECSSPTPIEINILKNQQKVFVTSHDTKRIFEEVGIKNAVYLPLGFDSLHFFNTNKQYYQDDRVTFLLGGKCENRKHTLKSLRAWAKKYGNQPGFYLNCLINNVHFGQNADQKLNQLIGQALEGQRYWNINFVPYLKTNAEVNDLHNACDIYLGMSGGEGFDLPLFNSIALGKHAVVLNAHVHKDYCTDENSVLIYPNGKVSCVDNVFFHANTPFNQGEFYTFDDEEFIAGCETAIERVRKNRVNEAGLYLQSWTYEQTVNTILENI